MFIVLFLPPISTITPSQHCWAWSSSAKLTLALPIGLFISSYWKVIPVMFHFFAFAISKTSVSVRFSGMFVQKVWNCGVRSGVPYLRSKILATALTVPISGR
eukprot:Lithocolla_globosa_v1_NODE_8029_length_870_cov_19.194595.p3 type:complete len:102 gc:universal NODE_8029_length_870_cov_19.194595:492-797(+)